MLPGEGRGPAAQWEDWAPAFAWEHPAPARRAGAR